MLTIPGYTVHKELGRGGMGVVYLAHNTLMDRLEVVKVIKAEAALKSLSVDRFLKEIQAAARLNHPNVVTAYSALRPDGGLALAMAYVDGTDLDQLVKAEGPLSVRRACNFVAQAATGLQHALDMGLCHRDIKPSNLMVAKVKGKSVVKVLDFGLAKVRGAAADDKLTGDGQMMGTPAFVAPEQARDAAAADTRADVYSLGCTLYFLLTGRPPFRGSLTEVLIAHQTQPPPLADLPPEVAAVAAKMMAKDPADRYQTPDEVAKALLPFARPAPPAAAETKNPETEASRDGDRTRSYATDRTEPLRPTARRSNRTLWLGLGGLGVAAALTAVAFLVPGRVPPAPPEPPLTAAAAAPPPPFSFDGLWRFSRGDGAQLPTTYRVAGAEITFGDPNNRLLDPVRQRPPREWSREGNTIRVTAVNDDVTTLDIDPNKPNELTGTTASGQRVWWDRVAPDGSWPHRMVPLFDGATLTWWKEISPPETKWSVLDGKLVGRNATKNARSDGWLVTARPPYRNFRLRVEASRTGHDTSISFGVQGTAHENMTGYAVVLRGVGALASEYETGTVVRFNTKTGPKVLARPTRNLDRPGVNLIEVDVSDQQFTVRVNGQLAVTASDAEYSFGGFGLHCRHESQVFVHKFEADRRPD